MNQFEPLQCTISHSSPQLPAAFTDLLEEKVLFDPYKSPMLLFLPADFDELLAKINNMPTISVARALKRYFLGTIQLIDANTLGERILHHLDKESATIRIEWTDKHGKHFEISQPDTTILSENCD